MGKYLREVPTISEIIGTEILLLEESDVSYSATTDQYMTYILSQLNSNNIFNLTTNTSDDIQEGSTQLFYSEERVDDRVNALLQEGDNVTLTYADVENTLTITAQDTTDATNITYDNASSSLSSDNVNDAIDEVQDNIPTANGGLTNTAGYITAASVDTLTNKTLDVDALGNTIENISNSNIKAGAAIDLSKLATDPLARANHTGTQIASTISDFSEAVDDRVNALLQEGSNVTLTYADASGTLTIDVDTASISAGDISFDPSGTNLISTDTQAAIAELDTNLPANTSDLVNDSGFVTSHSVLVSADDDTAGSLEDKLVAGDFITFTTNNPGVTETLTIDLDYTGITDDNYTTSDSLLYITSGGAVQKGFSTNLLDRANHTGTQTASTISDFETAITGSAREFTKTQNFNATTLVDGATISWDLESNQVASVTLAGNRTLDAPTNLVDGAFYFLKIIQDATGTRTLTFNSVYKFPGETAPTLSDGSGDIDIITFYCDGTNLYGVWQGDFG